MSFVKYSSSYLEEIVSSLAGWFVFLMIIKSCHLRTVTIKLLDQELWALHSQISVQPATCLMLEGTRSCRTLPWGVHIQLFSLQRRGREALMMFATVVLIILVKEVLISLWGPVALMLSAQSFRSLYVYK